MSDPEAAAGSAPLERLRTEERGLPAPEIFYRSGYYASVAVASGRAEAAQHLALARELRHDAYITPMSTWCRSRAEGSGFTDCESR
jgi:hypothetical protein